MNRQELKAAALKERIASLTANYEEEIANLRVDYTVLIEENRNLEARIAEMEGADETEKEEGPSL